MRKYMRILFLIPLCSIIFVFLGGAITPEWKLVSRLEGTAESFKADENAWIYISAQRMLKDGDKARTQENSRAKIQLADQSEVIIGSSTTVEIAKFQLKEDKRIVELKLGIGRIKAQVSKFFKGESSFKVETTKATLAAKGTEFYVDVENTDESGSQSNRGDDKLIAFNNEIPAQDGSGGPLSAADGESVYFEVIEGEIVAATNRGTHTFYEGDTGYIDAQGTIFSNPSEVPSQFTRRPGWNKDKDLRKRLRLQALNLGQPDTAPHKLPNGNRNPRVPQQPPVFVPSIENTGTIHIIIK